MTNENKYNKVGDKINVLFMEALGQQKNEIMDNFMQILWQVNIATREPSTSNHFKGVIPFKVQVEFYIPLFEGKIDVDDLEKWLSLLKDYCFVKYFSTGENITFTP